MYSQKMISQYLHIIQPDEPCNDLENDMIKNFPFPLDPFQKHALSVISKGENVLCCAKTGSGKSAIADMLIYHILKKGGRVFYTTPIKSLSNQKFHDLKQMFPSVGIMTGDIKYRPDAQIIIMTTEILRNLLYKQGTQTESLGLTASISLEGLAGVVFDEVHYINDRERGKVWEETMILLKPEVQLVLLSATIDRPELFGAWLADLKQKQLHLISTTYRIVPLLHQVLCGVYPYVLMDNKEIFNADEYRTWLQWRASKVADKRNLDRAVASRRAGGYDNPVAKGAGGMPAFTHQLNETIQMFQQKNLMPAIFFILSRAGCEKYAKAVQGSLITSSESAAIQHIWDFHLHVYKDVLEHLPQAHTVLDLVKRGIAFHHSGLLPMLREMIEILFGKGLIKALFATETFAVGLNMPTKTVVFVDLKKYSEESQGMRLLRTDEYIQMAGRAGRRGKDDIGHVFYLPQHDPVETFEMKNMMMGAKAPITSRMDFGYDFLLKTVNTGNLRWMDIMEKSYWFQQREAEKKEMLGRIQELDKLIAAISLPENVLSLCQQKQNAEENLAGSVNAAKREAQRQLDSVKNKMLGPAWDTHWKTWTKLQEYKNEKEKLAYDISVMEKIRESTLKPRIELLKAWRFLEMEEEQPKLTREGTLATELNEGHPILMTRAYTEGLCSLLEQEDFIALFAAFLVEGKEDSDSPSLDSLNISSAVKKALWRINDWAIEYSTQEERKLGVDSDPKFWELKTNWIEPLLRWYHGESAPVICQEYGIYEGNFMRCILKVANIVEEWTSMASYCQDIKLLEKLEGIRSALVRDIAKPESLYLRL